MVIRGATQRPAGSASAPAAPTAVPSSFMSGGQRALQSVGSVDADKLWGVLRDGIEAIFNAKTATLSFEELYRHAYCICLNKHGDHVYTGVHGCLSKYLE